MIGAKVSQKGVWNWIYIRQIEGRALQKMHATLSELVDRPEELFEN